MSRKKAVRDCIRHVEDRKTGRFPANDEKIVDYKAKHVAFEKLRLSKYGFNPPVRKIHSHHKENSAV